MIEKDADGNDAVLQDGGADEGAEGVHKPDPANDGGADRGADHDPGESEADGAA